MMKKLLSTGRLGGLLLAVVILGHHLLTEGKALFEKDEEEDEGKEGREERRK